MLRQKRKLLGANPHLKKYVGNTWLQYGDPIERELFRLQLEGNKLMAELSKRGALPESLPKGGRRHKTRLTTTVTPTLNLSERRARTVARIIGELDILKPEMHGEHNYAELKQKHPNFLTFRLTDGYSDLRELLVNIQDHRRHIRLAQQLAAAHHSRELSTIQTDWKKHKPKQFRQVQR